MSTDSIETRVAQTPNIPLLRQTFTHIEDHPHLHDQETWHCGTAACFAGWAAQLDGGVWVHETSEFLRPRPDDPAEDVKYLGRHRKGVHAASRAKRILGLTDSQAEVLFNGDNDLEDLRELVDLIADGAL